MNTIMDDDYLTVEEVAKKLKLQKMTIYRMAKKGQIPAMKFGKVWRISNKKLQELFEKNLERK